MRRFVLVCMIVAANLLSQGYAADSVKQQLVQQIERATIADPNQASQLLERLKPLIKPEDNLDQAEYFRLESAIYSALGYGDKTLASAVKGLDLLLKSQSVSLQNEANRDKIALMQSKLLINKADAHYFLNDYTASNTAAAEALEAAELSRNKKQIAFALISIAEMSDLIGAHDKSISLLLSAQEMSESIDDNRLKSIIFSTLGNIYVSMEKNELAIENYQKAIELHDPNNIFSINILNFNIANALYQLDKNDQSLHYLERVISDSRILNDQSSLAYAYFTRSEIYAERKEFDKALSGIEKAEELLRIIKDTNELFNLLTSKVNIYIQLEELSHAEEILVEVKLLMNELSNTIQKRDWHYINARFWAAKKDYQKAHKHALDFAFYDHKYLMNSTSDKMQRLRLEFNTKDLELEREKLERLNAIKETELTKSNSERVQYWYISIITSISLIFTFLLIYRQHKTKQVLAKLATFDALTGLRNRRSTKELLDKEFQRYLRYKDPFCIALFDIDNFKVFNDSYGHSVGDQVLSKLGKRLQPLLRDNDILCRWGGEEFLILLPSTQLKDAASLGERLLERTRRIRIDQVSADLRVSFSMGIVQVNPHSQSTDELINEADKAVYRAKAAGKNQIVCCMEYNTIGNPSISR
ncbi:diguanylate cyclase [Aliikangiella marina]|uniref:diguanylate cyclase n=1 Tax=Aliikangiella marina TaxID=1712262 RepID=A0A545TBV7_9GAMM|nr:diguanylate cyclase [Aliikangiella marina]TQV74694.1 diguanylate cyclase [Aliikangiella marina]